MRSSKQELPETRRSATVETGNRRYFPCIYRKQLTMREIKRVVNESIKGRKMASAPIAAKNKLSSKTTALI